MQRAINDLTLELSRGYDTAAVTVKRGDTHRTLQIRLTQEGRPYPISAGCRAVFTAVKPDGSHLFNACTITDGVICYDLTPQTTALPGQLDCEIRLYGENDALLTSAAFLLTVSDTVYRDGDETVVSSGEATALTQLMTEADEKIAQMETVLDNEANHAIIDDENLGADAWSAKNIVDKLCPDFTKCGALVDCAPVEGYPLEVISTIDDRGSAVKSITLQHSDNNSFTGGTTLTLDLANLEANGTMYFGSYNWTTGLLDTGEHGLFQHDPKTNTFTEISDLNTYVPVVVRAIPGLPGTNYFKSNCGETTVIGKADPRKTVASLQKNYELIEDITLTEETDAIRRTTDPNGNAYNFSAVRVFTEIPACGGSGVNHQLFIRLGVVGDNWYYYWCIRDGIKAAENRDTVFVAHNDHGFIDTYGATAQTSQRSSFGAVNTQPFLCVKPWKNVNQVHLTLFPTSIVFPVGTRIQIYGVRG